jgi:hypothetical protein
MTTIDQLVPQYLPEVLEKKKFNPAPVARERRSPQLLLLLP